MLIILAWMTSIRFIGRSYSPPITKLGDSSTYISSIVEKPSIEELELAIVNGNTVDAVVNGNKAGAPIP